MIILFLCTYVLCNLFVIFCNYVIFSYLVEYRNLFELQNMVSPLDVHCSTVDLYTPGLDREAEDRYLVYVQVCM